VTPVTQGRVGVDEPAHTDGFVRGLSEAIGGPLGRHAVRPPRSEYGGPRFWNPIRIVLLLTCVALSLHWVQKSPCRDGAWHDLSQYKEFCYTDVLALYYAEGLRNGELPYRDHPVEYPVVTGAFMGVLGLGVHALGTWYASWHPDPNDRLNEGEWAYNANALVLCALGVATVAMILALRRRRPWDAALFGLAPALFFSATVNWDLLVVALAAAFLYAWARRKPVLAGVLLGFAVSAKFYPVLLLGPLLLLAIRAARWRNLLITTGVGAFTWAVLNVPIWIAYPAAWREFWHLNRVRPIDWGTLWYILARLPGFDDRIAALNNQPEHGKLNAAYFGLFLVACLAIAALAVLAPRRPRLAQLSFLVVAAFLVFGKVWSQQYVLWLLPLAVLARPKWGAFLAWQLAEVGYFLAFYGELMGAELVNRGLPPVFNEWVFLLASGLRIITLCVLMGFVVRDVWYPELDAVRHSYPDDPDGGDFDGAPDAPPGHRRLVGHLRRLSARLPGLAPQPPG